MGAESGPSWCACDDWSCLRLILSFLLRSLAYVSFCILRLGVQTQQVDMAMNMSGTLNLVRRYMINHHQRDSRLRAYLESLTGEHEAGLAESMTQEDLQKLVIYHERDMRAQTEGEMRRRGTLRKGTLEQVHAADEENPPRYARALLVRSVSAKEIRTNTSSVWKQLRKSLRVAAHAEGREANKAWLTMVKLLRSDPEVAVRWVELCANNSQPRELREVERARCIDALAAADLASTNMAAQRVIVNILASASEPPEMQEYTLGSLSSVGLPGPPLVVELARAALRSGKRQFAHALGNSF